MFRKHLFEEHQTTEPDGHGRQLYDPRPLVNGLVMGTISIEDAKQLAIAKIEEMASVIGKPEFLEDPWGRKGNKGSRCEEESRKPPKDVQSSKGTAVKLVARPLGDKTPYFLVRRARPGDIEVQTLPEVQDEGVQAEDYDEIEYMPPPLLDDATDRFYAAEKEGIDDTGLLEASGVVDSPSRWNFFELPEDGNKVRGLSATPKQSANVQAARPSSNCATITSTRGNYFSSASSEATSTLHFEACSSRAGGPYSLGAPGEGITGSSPCTPSNRSGSRNFDIAHRACSVPTRPATSASLRPPTGVMSAARQTTNTRAGETVPPAKSEFALEFGCVEDVTEDFMFDV
ncbi:hypothetical protein EDB84DRAFT_1561537 [Lactarius hengduanensis]|nr:hypothetical protein EDB84DRAFT_1561537 [Lactarius hengduanensis]